MVRYKVYTKGKGSKNAAFSHHFAIWKHLDPQRAEFDKNNSEILKVTAFLALLTNRIFALQYYRHTAPQCSMDKGV